MAPATPSGPRPLPEAFGRYRVLRRLGQGAMGAVYLAHDTQLDRRVALKVPHLGDDPDQRERFLREARAAAGLDHPNICPIYDVGATDGVLYLTMPFVEGKPLAAALASGPLPPGRAAALARTLALALAEAHDRGVIHRDLKPSNVLLDARGEPVLTDFGLARLLGRGEGLPAEGEILGTPAYMAPEQVAGDEAAHGPRTDVYSLGAVLYEMLTGRPPFSGPLTRVLFQAAAADPKPPGELCPGLDAGLEAVVLKALAKFPEDRFATMRAFAAALSAHAE